MKGVVLRICSSAELVDITHKIRPFAITEGAFVVSQMYRYFPNQSIHVVVVDPGVGTARRPILVEAGGQYFIGPDNGVFSMVYGGGEHSVREITNSRFFLPSVSQTFHGRDVFAPCAGYLAAGASVAEFGDLIGDFVRLELERLSRTDAGACVGLILKVDRFGNLITNFPSADFPDLHLKRFEVRIGSHRVLKAAMNYASNEPGEVFVIPGSCGYLEVAVNQASAAGVLGCDSGTAVELLIY